MAYSHRKEFDLQSTVASALRSLQRNILAGIIAIAPLFVTYLIFSFLLGILAKAGLPVIWLMGILFPGLKSDAPWIQFVLAILLTLLVLYLVGRVTSEVIGSRILGYFDSILHRLPVVAKIYGSVRQLMDNMMAKKASNQRVVLVEFPMAGQKCIGFLSRTMTDTVTGETVAAVLLPNAINPTSAILQLLPIRMVVETDMTMEQAMSMLLTGGAVGPETLRFYSQETLASAAQLPAETIAKITRTTESIVIAQSRKDPLAENGYRPGERPEEPASPVYPPADRPLR